MLALYGADGFFIGNLDSIAVTPVGTIETSGDPCRAMQGIALESRGPVVSIDIPFKGNYSLRIIALNGKQVAFLSGKGRSIAIQYGGASPRGLLL